MNRHRKRPRRTGVAWLVFLVVAAILAVVLVNLPDRTSSGVYGHVEEFQAMADEHGPRTVGSVGYEAAAEYVEEQLEATGMQSRRQYFSFERRGTKYETFNIIAETTGDEVDEEGDVVMLGAHLDGVSDSPAINDNASGSAALLEAAAALGELGEVANTVRLVWWGAEEHRNSPGSRHYVKDLAENDPDGLDDIRAYLNFDMVASPNHVVGVYDAREKDSSLDVPEGSEEVMDVFTDYFEETGQSWKPTAWNFDSDQVAFIREDIPVGGLFTGSNEQKTRRDVALFGGTAGEPRDPNYHRSGDDLDNIDPEVLTLMSDAVVHAATTVAQDISVLD